ncbi:MAG: ABC transporter ATP-binding protein [Chloroflexi bacterium]|nr:ABC transporter ATP-binding protein [Chloroflexota bacterium]MDA8189125.1 ABC transporter ATP-binding protein [Dehalococcoidales bacterium]
MGKSGQLEQPLLRLTEVDASYGPVKVLQNVSLEVGTGEIVALLGANAAGKSTTLKCIMGSVRVSCGAIEFCGRTISSLSTTQIVAAGVGLVPEGRRIFTRLTVQENLRLGAFVRSDRNAVEQDLARIYGLFPRLAERRDQKGGTLSGGEQQMLAIGRALMSRPTLLCLDEPSMGLSPILVEAVFEIIHGIRREGTTILIVEQNAEMALSVADRAYVLQSGQIILSDTAANLLSNDLMRRAYLGV